MIVHAADAHPHTAIVSRPFMAQNAMVVVVHPPYSPAVAPPDCHLFGHVKGLLGGESFETRERLLSAIDGILLSLEKWTLTKVFLEWMMRPERSVEIDGDYVA
jgi:histone-lysine N-methyltransferase SETMAR